MLSGKPVTPLYLKSSMDNRIGKEVLSLPINVSIKVNRLFFN